MKSKITTTKLISLTLLFFFSSSQVNTATVINFQNTSTPSFVRVMSLGNQGDVSVRRLFSDKTSSPITSKSTLDRSELRSVKSSLLSVSLFLAGFSGLACNSVVDIQENSAQSIASVQFSGTSKLSGVRDAKGEEIPVIAQSGTGEGALPATVRQEFSAQSDADYDVTLTYNNQKSGSSTSVTFRGIDATRTTTSGFSSDEPVLAFRLALPDAVNDSVVLIKLSDKSLNDWRDAFDRGEPNISYENIEGITPKFAVRVGAESVPVVIPLADLKKDFPDFDWTTPIDLTLVLENKNPTQLDYLSNILSIASAPVPNTIFNAIDFSSSIANSLNAGWIPDANVSGRLVVSLSGFIVSRPIIDFANSYSSDADIAGSDLGGRNYLEIYPPLDKSNRPVNTILSVVQPDVNHQIMTYDLSNGSRDEGTNYAAYAVRFEDNLRLYRSDVFRIPVIYTGTDQLSVKFIAGRNNIDSADNVTKFNEENVIFDLKRPADSDASKKYEFRIPGDQIVNEFNFIRTAKGLPLYSDSVPVVLIEISLNGSAKGEVTTFFQNVQLVPGAPPARSELRIWNQIVSVVGRFQKKITLLAAVASFAWAGVACIPAGVENSGNSNNNTNSNDETDNRSIFPVGVYERDSSVIEQTNGYSGTVYPVNATVGTIEDYRGPKVRFNLQGAGAGLVVKNVTNYPQLQVQISGSELSITIKDTTNPKFPRTIAVDKSNFSGLEELTPGEHVLIDVNTIILSVIAERPEYANFVIGEIFIQHNGSELVLETNNIQVNGLNFKSVSPVTDANSVITQLNGRVSSFAVNGRSGILSDQFDSASGTFTTRALENYNQPVGVVVNEISQPGVILIRATQTSYQIEVTDRNNPSNKKMFLVGLDTNGNLLNENQVYSFNLDELEQSLRFPIGSIAIVTPGGARAGNEIQITGKGVTSAVGTGASQTIDLTDLSGSSQNFTGYAVNSFGAGTLEVINDRATITVSRLDPSAYTSIAIYKQDGSAFAIDQNVVIFLNNLAKQNLNYISIGAQDNAGRQVAGADLIALGTGDISVTSLRLALSQAGVDPDHLTSISVSASGKGEALLQGQTQPIPQVIDSTQPVQISVDTNGAAVPVPPQESEVIQARVIDGSVQNFSSLQVRHYGAGSFTVENGRGSVTTNRLDPSSYVSVGFAKQNGSSFALSQFLDIVLSNIDTNNVNYLTFSATDANGHGIFGSDVVILGTQDISTSDVRAKLIEKGINPDRLTSISVGVSAQGRALLPGQNEPVMQVINSEQGVSFALDLNGAKRSELREQNGSRENIYARIRSAIPAKWNIEIAHALGAYLGIDLVSNPREVNVATAIVLLPELGFEAGASIRSIAIVNAGKYPIAYLARSREDAEMIRRATLDLPANYQIKSVNAFEYLEAHLRDKKISEVLAIGLSEDEMLADRLLTFLKKEAKIEGRKKIVDDLDQFLGILGLSKQLVSELKAELLRRVMA